MSGASPSTLTDSTCAGPGFGDFLSRESNSVPNEYSVAAPHWKVTYLSSSNDDLLPWLLFACCLLVRNVGHVPAMNLDLTFYVMHIIGEDQKTRVA
jgi:hypothetical protein